MGVPCNVVTPTLPTDFPLLLHLHPSRSVAAIMKYRLLEIKGKTKGWGVYFLMNIKISSLLNLMVKHLGFLD